MTNIIDYAKKYGNFTFEEEPFNEVDAAILSLLSYIDFTNIIGPSKKGYTLKSTLEFFYNHYDLKDFAKRGDSKKDILKLGKIIKDKPRYQDILLYNYRYKISFEEQFGATSMKLPDNTIVISYEGTDHNLVGWEEDFAMCYKDQVPSEKDAITYLNKSVPLFSKEVILVGHSKGGHLAMIAAMHATLPIRLKIKKIYNFDGPGLRKNKIESSKYKRIQRKLNHIVPNHSIIGLLLRHDENIKVIKAIRSDLYAHSIFNWLINDTHFQEASLSRVSKNLDKSIILWLDNHEDKERETIVKNIFAYLRKNGLQEVTNLMKIKTLFTLLKNSKDLDEDTKNVMRNFIKFNVEYQVKNGKDSKEKAL